MSGNLPFVQNQPDFISTQVLETRYYYFDQESKGEDLCIICGGRERIRTDYVIDRKNFPYFAIEYVAEGKGSLSLAGIDYELSAGMAFAYAAGMEHSIRCNPDRPMLKYYVTFTGKGAGKLLSECVLGDWKVVQLSLPHEISEVFELMLREGGGEGKLGHKMCATLLDLLATKITQHAAPYGTMELRASETYQRAKRMIHEHFLTIKSAQEAADLCHINHSYLSRLFQRYSDITPYRLIMKLKMNRAAEILVNQQMLVKEVADELGFSDPYHFSHAFKRVYGISPEHFARYRSKTA